MSVVGLLESREEDSDKDGGDLGRLDLGWKRVEKKFGFGGLGVDL